MLTEREWAALELRPMLYRFRHRKLHVAPVPGDPYNRWGLYAKNVQEDAKPHTLGYFMTEEAAQAALMTIELSK